MTNATIFGGSEDNQNTNTPTATTEGQLFTALVGETQKYKTPEELAYILPTVSELEQWTVEFIKKKS